MNKKPTQSTNAAVNELSKKVAMGKMHRTTLDIEASDYKQLKSIAALEGVSVSEIIRLFIKERI
jgi:predicted DNA-binding ribbon-helix-helix protein